MQPSMNHDTSRETYSPELQSLSPEQRDVALLRAEEVERAVKNILAGIVEKQSYPAGGIDAQRNLTAEALAKASFNSAYEPPVVTETIEVEGQANSDVISLSPDRTMEESARKMIDVLYENREAA